MAVVTVAEGSQPIPRSLTRADFGPLAEPALGWLWNRLADIADQRGDPDLVEGTVTIELPRDPAERSAAVGFVPAGYAGAKKRVSLAHIGEMTARHAPGMTLGQLVSVLTGRPLAVKRLKRARDSAARHRIAGALTEAICAAHGLYGVDVVESLRQAGYVKRLSDVGGGEELARTAIEVVAKVLDLPDGERVDRRLLVPTDPHALDNGLLANVVLAVLAAAGKVSASGTTRERWEQAGVDLDDILGGLALTGLAPDGWWAPLGAVLTIPPRELAKSTWPSPELPGRRLFVTENPSVIAAAADKAAGSGAAPVICTMGTPSDGELRAVAAMAAAGWQIVCRFDFDPSGIAHTNALLDHVPDAIVWRMSADDYLASRPSVPFNVAIQPTPWDLSLAALMTERGMAAFEEPMLETILDDIRRGLDAEGR